MSKSMFSRYDASAHKALSFEKDAVFRLLVVMMVLLGWLAGMGAASLLGLEKVYDNWQLMQKSHISVYLQPDSAPEEIERLLSSLENVQGVHQAMLLDQESTLSLVRPYLGEQPTLPLPKIIDVTVGDEVDRVSFDAILADIFPLAEVDDARDMLVTVSHGVRLVQLAALGISSIVFVVMALLVALTVRAGLRAKRQALAVLQYIGATDGFVVGLVGRQVMGRAIVGAAGAAFVSCISLLVLGQLWPELNLYLSWDVWLACVAMPAFLTVVVQIAAHDAARRVVRGVR